METRLVSNKNNALKEVHKELDHQFTVFLKDFVHKSDYQTSEKYLTFSEFFNDRLLIVLIVKEGIPFSVFSSLQKYSPFTKSEWCNLLDLSTKSLDRYRQNNKRFKLIHSEKIIELAEVIKIGTEVFDNMDQLKLWLETPNFALGKQKPIDLLSNSYGMELVLSELVRIDEGIFA